MAEVLPLVREIFAMFDADGDGKLSKEEYKAYLRGIGEWGTDPAYTDEGCGERWPKECEDMESGTEGVGKEGFESILYGKYRLGKAQADLDKAMPALNKALKSLDKLSKADITEVKSFAKPPPAVRVVRRP